MNEPRLANASRAFGPVPNTVVNAALAFALAGALAPASAAPLPPVSSAIREIPMQSRHTYRYTCANGKTFKVTYLGAANGQSFALVPVSGRTMLLVATVAASGVRYQGDRYTWWTKGPRADLYDATAGDNAQPLIAGCATIMR